MMDPKKDERIEELLSKLQGIFGKLSHSEEEEAKQSIELPTMPPPAPEERESEEPLPEKVSARPLPLNLYAQPAAAPAVPPANSPPPLAEPAPAPAGAGTYETLVPTEDPERVIVPSAVYFPVGRENEAKSLAGKLETMAPKFTKVAFRLRIIVFMPYDPKSEWKDALLAKAAETQFQTVFIAVDRPLEETKRKSIAAELEAKNVYFQEVPISSIEKKAFYTDILLGLVFFFDSRKPPSNPEGTTA